MTDINAAGFINMAHSSTPGELAGENGQHARHEYKGGELQVAANHDLGFKPDMGPVPTA